MSNPIKTDCRRILIIDDNHDIFKDFQNVLTDKPDTSELDFLEANFFGESVGKSVDKITYELDYASQGEDGVVKIKDALLENRAYALAFVDMRMPPGWDGLETIRHLWKADPGVQVVICTAYSDYSWEEITERVGKTDKLLILKKTFDPTEVAQLASSLTEKWILARRASLKMGEIEQSVEDRTRKLERANERLHQEITERKTAEKALHKSDEKYREILRNISDFICVHDLDGKIIETNLYFKKHLGYTREEHANLYDLIPERYIPQFKDYLKNIKEKGKAEGMMVFIAKNGHEYTIEYRNALIRTGTGEYEVHGSGRDISERLKTEKALKESEKRYRMLFEKAGDAIFIIQDGVVKFANPGTLEIMEYAMEELKAIPLTQLIHPEDRDKFFNLYNKIVQKKEIPKYYFFRAVSKKGRELWLQNSAIRITWEGKPATLNITRDISRIKKLEAQLIQSQKMDAIGTLAGGIAHDFNNILSAIMGYTQMSLMDAADNSQISRKLERVLQASHRAKELVHQILTFSHQKEEKKESVKIRLIVKEALKLLRASIPSTIEFNLDIQKDTGVILADPIQIHQVLMNLCANAAHAMVEKGGSLGIRLLNLDIDREGAKQFSDLNPGPYVLLTVTDTGHGMDENTVEKIFNPYFTTKELGEGTGLGLSVVHGIIRGLGGCITVSSEKGKGTSFQLYIPRIEKDSVQEIFTEKIPLTGTETILIVDDEAYVLDMLMEMLATLGYRVKAKLSSIEALNAFQANPESFDLVLTDQTMPMMTGEKLAEKILAIRPDTPVILSTGFSEVINAEKARTMGIRAFIKKPVLISELAETIRKILD
ncbi:MAG: PAS domain S-box protein [Desulfobacterium sp.]|nr:PAS domain S-box protein [Desulfobacterium sp.]